MYRTLCVPNQWLANPIAHSRRPLYFFLSCAPQPKIYDFDVPANFEMELQALIPRHVKFTGLPEGTGAASFHELREFFYQVRCVALR